MAYITRNANILLLFLILISAGALVAATVFFQENFDRINRGYTTKLTQLTEVSKDLEQKQAALDQIKSELTLKSAREEQFTQQYTDVKTEKTTLEGQKAQLDKANKDLSKEVSDAKSNLISAQNALEASEGENARLKVDLVKAISDAVTLKKQKDDYAKVITARDAKISCLETKNDTEENTC